MNATERKLLLIMLEHLKTSGVIPRITELSRMCGMREYSIYEAYRHMESLGFAKVTKTKFVQSNSVSVELTDKAEEVLPRLRELA